MTSTKTRLAILALFGGLAAGAARAEGLYVGGSLGATDWRDSINGIGDSRSGTAYKFYGGLRLTPNFALEAGTMSLGSFKGAGDGHARGEFVDAVGLLPLDRRWTLLGRLGVVNAKTVTSRGSDWGTGLKLGAGVQYAVTSQVSVRGEWERYRLDAFDAKPVANQWTLGVNVGF